MIDDFLRSADALVTFLDGGKEVKMSLRNAVGRAQAVSALKGNSHSQKYFLQRDSEMRQKRAEEIEENHRFWKQYIQRYDELIASDHDDETTNIERFPHPEELHIPKDGFVTNWIGGDPWKAAETRVALCKLRHFLLLQAEKDRRHYEPDTWTYSEYLTFSVNLIVPGRLKLDDVKLMMQMDRNRTLNKLNLQQQINTALEALGLPKASERFIMLRLADVLHVLGLSLPKSTSLKRKLN